MPKILPASLSRHVDKTSSRAKPGNVLSLLMVETAGQAREAAQGNVPDSAVHEARKAMKRMRALLRLVGGEHRATAGDLRRDIARTARTLSGTRDDEAVIESLKELVSHGSVAAALAQSLGPHLVEGPGELESFPAIGAVAGLADMLLEQIPLVTADVDAKALLKSLTQGYRRAQRAARHVRPDNTDALHELRKHVIVHRYQMEVTLPWWPRLGEAWVAEAQRLRDRLGRHHDLDLLIARLSEHTDDIAPETAALVMDIAHKRQQALAHSALQLHARLFAETPRAFRRRLKAYVDRA